MGLIIYNNPKWELWWVITQNKINLSKIMNSYFYEDDNKSDAEKYSKLNASETPL